ncbi:hypothetical protein ACQP1V_36320 [Microtetraspora malaysiensis]|uniref:hypothetical protein n=1 Tax=Microtetraspora malaysiensis TaxID=161358 RepID=UPI003D900179
MSIWSSVPGRDILALDGHSEAANYRAEGEANIEIDVATTNAHDHIRLALWGGCPDVCALLSPETARQLRDRLSAALDQA